MIDDDALRALPLPLAQLARRSLNAQTSRDRCYNAYFLWEAALKLAGCTAIIEYVESGEDDPQLSERLQNLARPALGHWWEFVRRLAPVLATRGDRGFSSFCSVILGSARDDLPRLAGLDAVLQQTLDGKSGARSLVRIPALFDRLIQLRNEELGHGATGQRPVEFYDRLAPALLAGMMGLLDSVAVLAGRRLLYIADVRRLTDGNWLIERYELIGESPRRLESLELSPDKAMSLPLPERVYLLSVANGPDGTPIAGSERTVSLHPLLLFESDELAGKTFFMNARRRSRQAQYLCYTTGEVVKRESLGQEHRELLSRILKQPVRDDAVKRWEAQSQAEEPIDSSSVMSAPRRALGEFELLSRIGRGGMAVVHRAWQPSLGRQVALKSLVHIGDPKAQARFAREIRALGRVEHPHLVKVYSSGSDGEQWFYAMELLEGADLANVCQRLAGTSGTEVGESEWRTAVNTAWEDRLASEESLSQDTEVLPLLEQRQNPHASCPAFAAPLSHATYRQASLVLRLLQQVAEATQALHEAGIVHRDIKPGNIMVSPDGMHAVLMDLGLAQLEDDTAGRLTRTRQFVGTLRFASPEQVLAAGTLDCRSDVYSLGATLWELLTLRPLFGAGDDTPTPDLMLAIQSVDPDDPRRYNPNVPRDLAAIIQRCLEKRRERRYPTAQALADDLGRFLRGEPVSARPVTQLERSWRWCLRNPVVSTLVASVLMAIIAGGIGMTYFGLNAMRSLEAERQANQQKVLAEVDALLYAVPAAVPSILANLETGGAPVLNRLRELQQDDSLPVIQQRRVEMALLPTDSSVRPSLVEGLLESEPAECLLLRDVLADHGDQMAPELWQLVDDPGANQDRRFRAAVALAQFDPISARWTEIRDDTVRQLLSTNPLHLGVWKQALRPVADSLIPALIEVFKAPAPEMRQQRNVAAFVLVDYARDSVDLLVDLAANSSEQQFGVVFAMLAEHGDAAIIALRRELTETVDTGAPDATKEALARRQANAAVALVRMGDTEALWPMLVHSPDPRRRSLLIHRLATLEVDSNILISRLLNNDSTSLGSGDGLSDHDDSPGRSFQEAVLFDPATSIRRALIQALGEYDERALTPDDRNRLVPGLLDLLRHDPDAGVHSAAEWLLRRWGRQDLVEGVTSVLACRAVTSTSRPPADAANSNQRWFVNGEGQTFVVIDRPVEFLMGSTAHETVREGDTDGVTHPRHLKRIGRRFAIAATEVTVEQFLRFRSDHSYNDEYSPTSDCPVNLVNWYDAVAYCNWLSEQEGLTSEQWCYLPNEQGEYAEGMTVAPDYLQRPGYRLPSEAEWEFVCRAGADTRRFYGQTEELLEKYAWYLQVGTTEHRMIPTRTLKPNDLGLFDIHGNVWERCHDLYVVEVSGTEDNADDSTPTDLEERIIRGGSLWRQMTIVSSAREKDSLIGRHNNVGFRVVLSLP